MIRPVYVPGYNGNFEQFRIENGLCEYEVGRVTSEHKERYIVKTDSGDFEAEVAGALRYRAVSREDYPAVGDWVSLTPNESGVSIIQRIFPRFSVLSRTAVGDCGSKQIIAANVDCGVIVLSADRDFNLNRLERYLTICNTSKIHPLVVLTKIDLLDEDALERMLERIRKRVSGVDVVPVSDRTQKGYSPLSPFFVTGNTYCLLGSSGVGKSTLMNYLSGKNLMRTNEISPYTCKGMHTTSHRELAILQNGATLIDNPGMREVGISDDLDGLNTTFSCISEAARTCRYKDCTHTVEPGCSVLRAVRCGEIDRNLYENYLKLERERMHFEAGSFERRRKDRAFGKMMKNYFKGMNDGRPHR